MRWMNGIETDNEGNVVTHEYVFDYPRMLLIVVMLIAVALLVRRFVRRRRAH